jgi:hypothetical protein
VFSLTCLIRICVVVFVALAGVASPPIFAATEVTCSPFVPHKRVVGNTATDIHCDDDNIQAAIDNTVCPNTTIFLTAEHTYSAQHLSIQNKSLSIVGSNATSCSGIGSTGVDGSVAAAPTAPVTTISGAGNGGNSVISIGGTSNVTLQFVEITGGSVNASGHGGGVNFNGIGSLTIDTSTIDSNSAGFGGGIEMNGNGGDALLTLKAYSIIESNTASGNGGGINIEGFAQLVAVQPFTLIGFNHAPNGKGGGVAVVSPARADIGSPGYIALPVINGNDAALGGGLSAQSVGIESFPGIINLFTTDPLNPVTVAGNFASQAGGGVYLKPFVDNSQDAGLANLCASDFRIDGNSAPEGTAVFADTDSAILGGVISGGVLLNQTGMCGPSPGAVPCASGVICNTMNDNRAVDGANHPQPGSVLLLGQNGTSSIDRVVLRNNSGAHAIHVIDQDSNISNCLVADNDLSAETLIIDDEGGASGVNVTNCTIANNAHNSGSIIRTGLNVTLRYLILDQPAMSSASTSGSPAIFADDVLAADPTGLPVQANIVQGEPIFVNAAAGNYHLRAFVQAGVVTSSPGMDFGPPVSGDDRDLDGNPHDQDVPAVPDLFGVRDLGAYEAQPILDRIFVDAFGDPISLVF